MQGDWDDFGPKPATNQSDPEAEAAVQLLREELGATVITYIPRETS